MSQKTRIWRTHVAKYEDAHAVVPPSRDEVEDAPVGHRVHHPVRQLAPDELEHLDGAELPLLWEQAHMTSSLLSDKPPFCSNREFHATLAT